MNATKVLAAMFNIQPRAAEILLLLIKNGPMTVEEVVKAMNIDESTVRVILWKLKRRGLVKVQKVNTVKRIGRKPYKYIVSDEVRQLIIEKYKELEKIIKNILNNDYK